MFFLVAIAALYPDVSLTHSRKNYTTKGRLYSLREELHNKGKTSYSDMGISKGH